MTAKPDLPINDAVPAPTKIEPGNLFLWNRRQMQVYAQACVAHAVAPLQAEIEGLREQLRLSTVDQVNAEAEANDARAEIEALRAEVDEWKDVAKCASEQQDSLFREARALNELADNLRAEVYFRDSVIATHAADTREYQKRISQAKARAERLAEALREARDAIEDWAGYASDYFREKHDLAGDLAKIDALLRDQEEGK